MGDTTVATESAPGPAVTPSRRVLPLGLLAPVICAIAAFGVLGLVANSSQGQAAATVTPTKFTCEAQPGEVVKASYTVTNVSTQQIKLLGGTVHCFCTVPRGLPMVLQAGRSGQIELMVSVGQGDEDGKFVRSVQLLSTSAGTVPELIFEARVVPAARTALKTKE